jgi:thiopeptide-type bacteriocin biosynthesis protein
VLLAALIPEVAARRAMIEATRDQLAITELGDGVEVGRWLGNYARQHRRTLEAVGGLDTPDSSLLHAPLKRVCTLQSTLVALGARLRNLAHTGQLTTSMSQLSQSLIHMHVNRMLRGEHRRQEAVIYDLLARVYRSREARQRRASPPM